MIPTRVHGILDYVVGAILILAPYLLGFADGTAAQWVPMVLGVAAIAYSLVTEYELSLAKLLPLWVHLGLDIASGVLLAASPWLFGFADRIWWPHVLFGAIEIIVPLLTSRHPFQPGHA
ncbi:MAG: hypothetical protein JWQ22_3235 [Devosia sp.]|nr:hypothetical protein [Devosia sp.]